MPTEELSVETILGLIRTSGGRATSAKRTLLEVLLASSDHLTAEEITTAVQSSSPETSPSTIYRNLEELEQLGIVVHAHLGRAAAVYHLAGPVHGHLICSNCGQTIEVPSAQFESFASDVLSKYGFLVDRHHLAIAGLCQSCYQQ